MPARIIAATAGLLALSFLSACATPNSSVIADAPSTENEERNELIDASPDTYILGQGDRISIQVFDEPDLTLESTVSATGVLSYSYLGDIKVAGKTPSEVERQISALLRDGFLVNPSVNVSVSQFRPFFISGEVRSPGSYPFQPGLTLDKAIALAGGLTDRASQRQMFIQKEGAPASEQSRSTLGEPVGPGDTITIKEGFF